MVTLKLLLVSTIADGEGNSVPSPFAADVSNVGLVYLSKRPRHVQIPFREQWPELCCFFERHSTWITPPIRPIAHSPGNTSVNEGSEVRCSSFRWRHYGSVDTYSQMFKELAARIKDPAPITETDILASFIILNGVDELTDRETLNHAKACLSMMRAHIGQIPRRKYVSDFFCAWVRTINIWGASCYSNYYKFDVENRSAIPGMDFWAATWILKVAHVLIGFDVEQRYWLLWYYLQTGQGTDILYLAVFTRNYDI